MYFGPLPIAEAAGCLLAHSLTGTEGRVRKGTRLGTAELASLAAAGHATLVVARLDADDEHEDGAAARIARALAGAGVRVARAATGRANLFATRDGLVTLSAATLLEANRSDEGITVATLGADTPVIAGRMVATVKIIPFSVPIEAVDRAVTCLAATPLDVAARREHGAALVHTVLPTLRDAVIDKTSRVTRERLAARGARLVDERRAAHEIAPLARALDEARAHDPDWLLVVGASAIADRADVIPAAIEAAGGRVRRFGLPVDPGNLLLLGELGRATVIGLPGCARSPRDNGLDRVLDRLASDLPLDDGWLDALAVGGLLDEIVERPTPRVASGTRERVGTIVLAAGSSRRAGPVNKLLHEIGGEPMVRRVARAALADALGPVVVVTGHERERVERALAGLDVALAHNAAHASGMGGSIARGVAALLEGEGGNAGRADRATCAPGGENRTTARPPARHGERDRGSDGTVDAVVVRLGDMPHVAAGTVGALAAAFRDDPQGALFVPLTLEGRRGNPVLIARAAFDSLLALDGDAGARGLIASDPGRVREVRVEDPGILVDHDTAEDLGSLP